MKVYGIKSCDKVRAAMKALTSAGRAPELVDIREQPLQIFELEAFHSAFGDRLVNRQSTTWRGLSEAERGDDPVALIAAHPALMKRPVIVDGARMSIGWDTAAQAVWL